MESVISALLLIGALFGVYKRNSSRNKCYVQELNEILAMSDEELRAKGDDWLNKTRRGLKDMHWYVLDKRDGRRRLGTSGLTSKYHIGTREHQIQNLLERIEEALSWIEKAK